LSTDQIEIMVKDNLKKQKKLDGRIKNLSFKLSVQSIII
jgi:hypothetical protein